MSYCLDPTTQRCPICKAIFTPITGMQPLLVDSPAVVLACVCGARWTAQAMPFVEPITPQAQIVADVLAERVRQDERWGEPNHDLPTWITILAEEVGEVAKAYLDQAKYPESESYAPGPYQLETMRQDRQRIRAELVQVAAVAVAALECLDKQERI